MTIKVRAIFENGVFRPYSPVPLAEGSEVELTINSNAHISSLTDAIKQIASLPPEGPADGFSGADHDQQLYGRQIELPP